MLTLFNTATLMKDSHELWVPLLNRYLKENGIWTPLRVAGFIAQSSHESDGFTKLLENLNYSQQGLRAVFPKYFPDDATAYRYARQPQAIASRVYAGRLGNGSESSGEGWKYRGRGVFQITGKANYEACGKALGLDLVANPDLLTNKEEAIKSACWFWTKNKLNDVGDDIVTMTRIINGGKTGLAERTKLFDQCKIAFKNVVFV